MCEMVIVDGKANLLEVVGTTYPIGGLAHFLHRREKQSNQHADDGNHHQQLDQGKTVLVQPDLEKRSRRVSDQGIGTLVQVDSIVRVAVARATRVPLLCSGEKAAGSAPGWTGGGTARGRRRRALDAWPGSTG